MITKYGTKRTDQVSSDMDFGDWGEKTLIPWIENYFNKREQFKISYWYNSEYEAIEKLKLKGTQQKLKMKEYDLKFGEYYNKSIFPSREVLFEIKTDKYDYTGNVAFEKSDKGKPSGVFVTKSNYFIYFMPRFTQDNLYIIKSDKLKDLLSEEKWQIYLRMSGDLGLTANFIIPTNEFNTAFKEAGGRIETYTPNIPEKFNLSQINTNNKTVYYGKINAKDVDF